MKNGGIPFTVELENSTYMKLIGTAAAIFILFFIMKRVAG